MSLFVDAIDAACSKKNLGENGHAQWAPASSNDLQERIVQFQFKLVRHANLSELASSLRSILSSISSISLQDALYKSILGDKAKDVVTNLHVHTEVRILYKLIGQTRDIDAGKGERDLAYMMILVWWDFFPELAKFALECFVRPFAENQLPYGSWKDIKRFCEYVRTVDPVHPLIDFCVKLMCDQIRKDASAEASAAEASAEASAISLCARWVPRESSKTGRWLFRRMAHAYCPEFFKSAYAVGLVDSLERAQRKSYMTFARLISRLSRQLDTVQIKMCGGRWAEIDHHKTPSVALLDFRAAFMNNGKKRGPLDNPDRIQCALNLETYVNGRIKEGQEIKGKRCGLIDYVKEGIQLVSSGNKLSKDLINAQWESFMSQVGDLGNMVAMVDQSGSMSGDPYYAAVGLGIAVASRSALGPRVMTFSTEPAWVSLKATREGSFMECIKALEDVSGLAGLGTNFFKALKLILDACVSAKVPDSVVCNMTLAIFSDMQIDSYTNHAEEAPEQTRQTPGQWSYQLPKSNIPFDDRMLSMHERIAALYAAAGYSGVPHILFWNLRPNTNGFPTLSSMPGASMFSGFSPMLLNAFCEKGRDALVSTTPWDMLVSSLDHPRYAVLDNVLCASLAKSKTTTDMLNERVWYHDLHGAY